MIFRALRNAGSVAEVRRTNVKFAFCPLDVRQRSPLWTSSGSRGVEAAASELPRRRAIVRLEVERLCN
jgi:hypothetical protein